MSIDFELVMRHTTESLHRRRRIFPLSTVDPGRYPDLDPEFIGTSEFFNLSPLLTLHHNFTYSLDTAAFSRLFVYLRGFAMASAEIPFHATHRIGEGAFATVWRAEWRGKKVAVKELKHEVASTLDDAVNLPEIRHLRSIGGGSGDMVRLLQVVRLDERVFIVMELCEASLLDTLQGMSECGQKPKEGHVRWVMIRLLRALAFMHSRGILHRDVKSDNILLQRGEAGHASTSKLADFGQATSVSGGVGSLKSVLTPYVGTRWYRAPELLLMSSRGVSGLQVP